jgi:ABC-2 type transport system ATP-binding protein
MEVRGNEPMPNIIIEADGLVKRYGDFTAVKGVRFSVMEGEVFGLLGPNGAGKTTTIE